MPSNFKPALVVGGLLELQYRANRSQIRKEDGRIDFPSENRNRFSLGNTLFYAPVSVISGGKPLKPLRSKTSWERGGFGWGK